MTAPQDPRRYFALPPQAGTGPRNGPAAPDEESTVRLSRPDQVGTVRLGVPDATDELAATLRFTEDGAEDPAATLRFTEHGTAPTAPPEIRFGPGVPTPAAAEAWHGTARPDGRQRRRRRGRLLGGWLLPLAVLIAVLAYLAWQRYGTPLAVTGATVRTDSGGTADCDGTAVITGTLRTNGASGEVSYRWKRSDGTVSDALHQYVAHGSLHTDVVLRWSFNGHGTLRATATLQVLSPDPVTASTAFAYHCR